MLENEANQKEKLEEEIAVLKSQLLQMSFEADEVYRINILISSIVAYIL